MQLTLRPSAFRISFSNSNETLLDFTIRLIISLKISLSVFIFLVRLFSAVHNMILSLRHGLLTSYKTSRYTIYPIHLLDMINFHTLSMLQSRFCRRDPQHALQPRLFPCLRVHV